MNDFFIGLIRTYTPIVVGAALSWLITLGVELEPETQAAAVIALTGILQAAYYTLVRLAAERWPWAGSLLGVNIAPKYNE